MENNKNKKSVKFQGDMLNFCDFIQVFVLTRNHHLKDKEFVRFTAPKTLTGKRFGVNEQFPTEIENKRKLLYPVAKRAKRNKHNKVRLVRDKLFINGEEIIVEESGTINGEQQNMPHSQHLTQTKQPRRT